MGVPRPAVHGVVVLGGLFDLDLACNRSVLPLNEGDLARLDVDRLALGVGDIALILQFAQVVAATIRQVLDIYIALIVRSVLTHRPVRAIIEEEIHPIKALAGDRIGFVNQNP